MPQPEASMQGRPSDDITSRYPDEFAECRARNQVSNDTPSRKSSIAIASRGLWLPFSFRIKIIAIGNFNANPIAAYWGEKQL